MALALFFTSHILNRSENILPLFNTVFPLFSYEIQLSFYNPQQAHISHSFNTPLALWTFHTIIYK